MFNFHGISLGLHSMEYFLCHVLSLFFWCFVFLFKKAQLDGKSAHQSQDGLKTRENWFFMLMLTFWCSWWRRLKKRETWLFFADANTADHFWCSWWRRYQNASFFIYLINVCTETEGIVDIFNDNYPFELHFINLKLSDKCLHWNRGASW